MTHFPLTDIMVGVLVVCLAVTGGWVYLERLKIKNGYPLEGFWGQTIKPTGADVKTQDKMVALETENAALRNSLAQVDERLKTLERIVTDPSQRLARDIERLS